LGRFDLELKKRTLTVLFFLREIAANSASGCGDGTFFNRFSIFAPAFAGGGLSSAVSEIFSSFRNDSHRPNQA
jgi:hypothetical protein